MNVATEENRSKLTEALEIGRKVLVIEAKAIADQAELIDDSFTHAVDLIGACSGRLIVTGMGKSGHIAKKIAATFASTGTPAYFVHPAEASHGDLGMITSQDVVLAISNSGKTKELADLLAYSRRFNIPLIAMTGDMYSPLANVADVILKIVDAPEVCPLGLAPTTSTTVALALGDALAVSCIEAKGFEVDNFQTFHPGGKLGQQLLRVGDLMHGYDEVPIVATECRMDQVLLTMTSKSFGCAAVCDEYGMQGVITDGDLRRHMNNNLLTLLAAEVMKINPKTITADSLAVEALRIMNELGITSLFVIAEDTDADKGDPIGIIHIHDCLRAGVV